MAITIDSLVVMLGLDPTAFNDGQKRALADFKATQEAAKKTANDMEADGRQAARFYSNIKDEALSLIAVLVGAKDISGFVSKTVTDLSAVGRVAAVMGVATQETIAWGNAVERLGGNAQLAQQSMLGLSQTFASWKLGTPPGIEFRQALGLVSQTTGIALGPNSSPLDVIHAFAEFASKDKNRSEVYQVGGRLGLDQGSILEAMRGGRQVNADIAQSYANGIPTDADIKKVQALQIAFGNLAQSMKFAGTELVVDVADPLTHLMTTITGLVHEFPIATRYALAFVVALTAIKGLGFAGGVARALFGGGAAGAAEAGGAGVAGSVAAAAAPVAIVGFVGPKLERGFRQNQTAHPGAQLNPLQGAIDFFTGEAWWMGPPGTAPQAAAGGAGGAGAGAPNTVTARASLAQRVLQGAGFSSEQARGIVAGLFAETAGTLSATAKNPHSTAWGLAQWIKSSGRQDDFRTWSGHDIHQSSFGEQLQFILYEFTHGQAGAMRAVLGQTTAAGAAQAFLSRFEAPGAAGLALDMRNANRFLAGRAGAQVGSIVVNVTTTSHDPRQVGQTVGRAIQHVVASVSNNGPT